MSWIINEHTVCVRLNVQLFASRSSALIARLRATRPRARGALLASLVADALKEGGMSSSASTDLGPDTGETQWFRTTTWFYRGVDDAAITFLLADQANVHRRVSRLISAQRNARELVEAAQFIPPWKATVAHSSPPPPPGSLSSPAATAADAVEVPAAASVPVSQAALGKFSNLAKRMRTATAVAT